MTKAPWRLAPLSLVVLGMLSGVRSAIAADELIDGQCQPNPPINVAANCRSATFIDPSKVEVYNESRQFWLTTEYYGRGSNQNQVVRSMLYENVVCSERKIATTKIVRYTSGGATQTKTQPLEFILPRQQTRVQKNAVRFVCNLSS